MTTDSDRLEEAKKEVDRWYGPGNYEMPGNIVQWLIAEVENLRKQLAAARPGWCPVCHERVYNKVKAENIELTARLAHVKNLKQCGCPTPNWQNTGGTLQQCSHCGGWSDH